MTKLDEKALAAVVSKRTLYRCDTCPEEMNCHPACDMFIVDGQTIACVDCAVDKHRPLAAYLASLPSPEQSAAQQPATEAVRDVLAERARQISAEGWTPEHDDTHANGEMAAAAACYAFAAARSPHEINNRVWPWSWDWWKPTDPRRNCVKACALLLAQIEQLDRAGKRS